FLLCPPRSLLPLPPSSPEPQVGASYFYTAISDPSQGLPQFVVVGYVDGQAFVHYDSHSRRMQPRVSWMEKYVGKEDPQYWDSQTQALRADEETFRVDLETARNRYNQSEVDLLLWGRKGITSLPPQKKGAGGS
uniref:MHC class I-like antigen recognition-like domain-containing protein n=1 Tax=Pseudonaja textilis TaxID=8673 RepID=A0A670ZB74_PSETE